VIRPLVYVGRATCSLLKDRELLCCPHKQGLIKASGRKSEGGGCGGSVPVKQALIVPASQEAKAWGLIEPRSSRLALAT
jgi:hypothetical protein